MTEEIKNQLDELNSARRPWVPAALKPKDLKNNDKLLFSMSVNTNTPTPDNNLNSSYRTQFGLPLQSSKAPLRKLKKSKSISDVSIYALLDK